MAALSDRAAVTLAGLIVLAATLVPGTPPAAQPASGTRNVYGWPMEVEATPLAEEVEWVPWFAPGKDTGSTSGCTTTFGVRSSSNWANEFVPLPDGRRALHAGCDDLQLLRIPGGEVVWRVPIEGPVELALSPDGEQFLVVRDFGGVWLHRTSDGRRVATWQSVDADGYHREDEPSFDHAVISPDGRLAALGSNRGVHLVDVRSGETTATLGCTGWVETLRFSADGDRLLAFASNELRVWDVRTRHALFVERDYRWGDCVGSPALDVVWIGGDGGRIERIELRQDGAREAWTLPDEPDIYSLALLPGKARLAVGHHHQYTSIVDLHAGRETHRLEGSGAIQTTADGKQLLAVDDGVWGLWDTADLRPLRTGARHRGSVSAVATDGKLVASGDHGGTVIVRDRATGKIRHHLFGHADSISGLALAPAGSPLAGQIAVGEYEGAWLLDLATGDVVRRFEAPDRDVEVAFSPDGRTLIVSAWDDDCSSCGWAELWDTATLERRARLEGVSWRHFAFARDGKLLVGSGYKTPVQVVDLEAGRMRRTTAGSYDAYEAAAVRDDRYLVVATYNDRGEYLWTPGQGEKLQVGFCGWPHLTPDGRLLIAEDCESGYAVIDTADGRKLGRLPAARGGGEDHLYSTALSPDSRWLVQGFDSGLVRVHDLRSFSARGAGATVAGIRMSTDSGAVSMSDLGAIPLGAAPSIPEITAPAGQSPSNSDLDTIAVAPDGRTLAVGPTGSGEATLLDAATGERLRAVRHDYDERIGHLWFGASGQLVTSSEYGDRTAVHDRETGDRILVLRDDCNNAFVRPDGTVVCTGPELALRNADGGVAGPFSRYIGRRAVAAPPDASSFVLSRDGKLTIYDVGAGAVTERRALGDHWTNPTAVAITADGRRIVSAGSGVALLHDAQTGELLRILEGTTATPEHVAISADGAVVATADRGGRTAIWNGTSGELLAIVVPEIPVGGGIALSPDGRTLYTIGRATVAWWDLTKVTR